MAHTAQRTRLTGSALIGELAKWSDAEPAASTEDFAERLSRWLDWTSAISLSSTLNGSAATSPASAAAPVARGPAADEREYARVRAALVKDVLADVAGPVEPPPARTADARAPARRAAREDLTEFAPWRRRHLARQQAMETAIATLRGRLRATLSAASPALARLAALDAVMEPVVAAKERALLAAVPAWLEKRFQRLRLSPVAPAAPGVDGDAPADAWLAAFRHDLQGVLLAELDLRMQPIEGLVAALRSHVARKPSP